MAKSEYILDNERRSKLDSKLLSAWHDLLDISHLTTFQKYKLDSTVKLLHAFIQNKPEKL